MKVLFYLHNLWEISATTRLAIDLATVLREKYRIDIEFAVSKQKSDDIKNLSFNLHVLNKKGEISKAIALKTLIENNKYDIILSYMLTQNIILSIAKLLSKKTNTVYLGSVHTSDNYMKNNSLLKLPYRLLIKWLYENLDGIIVVSKAVEEDIHKAFFVMKDKLKVIYNYIDDKKIERLSHEELPPQEKEIFENPVIINVGRVEIQKGQEFLIKSFPIILKEIPESKLVIIGDGSLREKLEFLIRKYNLEGKAFILGYRENPFKYIAKSKVFAFPSLWEGTPVVILETQALGIPIVAFNSQGGHVDVLKDSGILVPEKDHKKLAKEIISLLKDRQKWEKYSKLSLVNIKNYSVEKKADEYYSYFLKKLEKK